MLNLLVLNAVKKLSGEFSQEDLEDIARIVKDQYLCKDFSVEEVFPYFDHFRKKYIPTFLAVPNHKPEINGSGLTKEINEGYIPKAIGYFNIKSKAEEE